MIALLALLLASPTAAEVVAGAPPEAWRRIAPENLVIFETAKGALTVELAPDFAPAHVAAIRALVRAHAFDGGAVVRVQDNYVVQWAAREPQPTVGSKALADTRPAPARAKLPAEYDRAAGGMPFTATGSRDVYAAEAGFSGGWPVAHEGGRAWLVHCYGMVGAGRDNPPDTGDGSELYAVTGHAPRHLDRNMAVVGRVVAGIAQVTALPRGTEALGFYKTAAERVPITAAHLAADTPGAQRFEVMRTDTPTFAAYLDARANRREPFFVRPAAAVDICNVPVPIRPVP